MASNTRKTWKRRVRKHVNAGKKRKAKDSKKSTPSAAELFASMGYRPALAETDELLGRTTATAS